MGNKTSVTSEYFVFRSVDGSVVSGRTARPGNALTLTLEMGLPPGTDPLASIQTHQVSCADGSSLGPLEAAITARARLTHGGGLSFRWDTDRSWAGQCRTLTISFDTDGSRGQTATFGPVSFR
jgi:hypothetical protein